LYKEFFEFKPTFKIFLAANAKPIIRGQDQAIWRRVRLVPFEVSIPTPEQDKRLPEKLKAELPGILSWAVEGCLAWQREGLGVPPEVFEATEEYRDEMNELGEFMKDCCLIKEDAMALSADLYKSYTEWAESNGERNPLSQNVFGTRLRERGFQSKRTTGGKRCWKGIGLLTRSKSDRVTGSDADIGLFI
jgi:putative DNA primase/helicase